MPDPNATVPNGQGAEPAQPQATPQPQPSVFNDLKQKKGFKSEEDLAKAYEEAEKAKSRFENTHGKIKQQLESAGYTVDENGDIKPVGQPQGQPVYPSHSQPVYPQGQPGVYPPQEPVYDPYTGQMITDPIQLQLARMPVGQREAFVVNAILQQREQQQAASFQAEAEVLSKPEAKGFEEDVKQVMRSLPLQHRADKKAWEDALLRVKGARYDQALKNAGQQGVESYLNKEGLQVPAGVGSQEGNVSLTPEQEQTYRYYQQHMPGTFKDKAHFLKATRPDGGR